MRPPLFIGQLALIRWAELINAIGKYVNESWLIGFRHRLAHPGWWGCLLHQQNQPSERGNMEMSNFLSPIFRSLWGQASELWDIELYVINRINVKINILFWLFSPFFNVWLALVFMLSEFLLSTGHEPLGFGCKETLYRPHNWALRCLFSPYIPQTLYLGTFTHCTK